MEPGERPLPWPAASGEKGNSGPLTIWKVPLAQMKGAIPGGRGQPSTHSQTQFSWRRSLSNSSTHQVSSECEAGEASMGSDERWARIQGALALHPRPLSLLPATPARREASQR